MHVHTCLPQQAPLCLLWKLKCGIDKQLFKDLPFAVTSVLCVQAPGAAEACAATLQRRLANAGRIQAASLLTATVFSTDYVGYTTNTMASLVPGSTAQADIEKSASVAEHARTAEGNGPSRADAASSLHNCEASAPALAAALQPVVTHLQASGALDSDFAWPLIRVMQMTGSSAHACSAAAVLLAVTPGTAEHVRALHKHAESDAEWLVGAEAQVLDSLLGFLPRGLGVHDMQRLSPMKRHAAAHLMHMKVAAH